MRPTPSSTAIRNTSPAIRHLRRIKLGMSLAALGQKEAACSTFGELKTKFPKAPETVRDEAKAEQKKTRC